MTGKHALETSCHPGRVMTSALLRGIGLFTTVCLIAGCTAITDFDDSRIKINLHKVLFEEDIVFYTSGNTGYISLPFADPFDTDECDSFDALVGNELMFTVAQQGDTVGHDITRIRVDKLPDAPGEFTFAIGRQGKRATISFYNRLSSTQPLVASGDRVTLLIHTDDNPLISMQTYAFDVMVQSQPSSPDAD